MASILILEDDFLLGQDFKEVIEEAGHKAFLVSSATEASQVCLNFKIDLAIVDIFIVTGRGYTPDGGLTFLTNLRQLSFRSKLTRSTIPVVAMSGGQSVASPMNPLETAMMMGANETLEKPFVADKLLGVIDRYV